MRPQHCTQCKKIKEVIAHHDDYAKPLDVRWLCRPCHQCWHSFNGEGLNYHLSDLNRLRSENNTAPNVGMVDERYGRMVEMAASGKNLRDIAGEFKISRERVRQIIGNPKRFQGDAQTPNWSLDRYGFSSIVDTGGNVIGCKIVSLMTIEEIKEKYPNAKIPTRRIL